MAGQPGRPGHDIRPGSCELAVDRIQRHWITGQAGDVPFVVGGTCSSPCCNQTSREGPGGIVLRSNGVLLTPLERRFETRHWATGQCAPLETWP